MGTKQPGIAGIITSLLRPRYFVWFSMSRCILWCVFDDWGEWRSVCVSRHECILDVGRSLAGVQDGARGQASALESVGDVLGQKLGKIIFLSICKKMGACHTDSYRFVFHPNSQITMYLERAKSVPNPFQIGSKCPNLWFFLYIGGGTVDMSIQADFSESRFYSDFRTKFLNPSISPHISAIAGTDPAPPPRGTIP